MNWKGLFSLSIKRCFRWNLLKRNYFFLVQKCKHQILGGPSLPTKRLHALHAYVYTLRGQEEKNLVLLRRFMQRLMMIVLFSTAADANNMNNAFFFIFIRYIRLNSWKLTCNFSSNTISMRLYYPINRYRKKAKLFRQSVQLIERQVLSNYLRGYKGEFLIWSWGLKNKVFLSMNFMTNFGLTSNTKSCAIFNSECMLVFAACSLLFRENQVKKLIHWGPL